MPEASYTCPYCRIDSEGGPACPHLRGAPADVRARTSGAGWVEQPPIRDLTRLHFSHSSCQISGAYVPVAELALDAADSVYFTHHALLHAEPSVDLDLMRMPSGWQRSLAGLPVYIMTARGPGHLAIRAAEPGETVAVPLLPGRGIDVAEHRFLGRDRRTSRYQWRPANVWLQDQAPGTRLADHALPGRRTPTSDQLRGQPHGHPGPAAAARAGQRVQPRPGRRRDRVRQAAKSPWSRKDQSRARAICRARADARTARCFFRVGPASRSPAGS